MTNTTPTTATYSLNAGQMITQAYRKLGILPSGGAPTADQMNQGIITLNLMLKSWQSDGINLWRQVQISVAVGVGQGKPGNPIVVTPPLMGFEEARLVVSPEPNLYERTLGNLTYLDYMRYPNKGEMSQPSSICYDKQENQTNFYIFPLSGTSCTINMTVGRPVLDITQASDTVDVPIEWQQTVVYNIAERLMDNEGIAAADPATAQRIMEHAAGTYQKLLDWDRPTSLFLRPFGKPGQSRLWK